MQFESVDVLQRTLADTVFSYAADRKKAAGRALGTLVELVTYYTLRAWELGSHIVIERSVPEFANPDIKHNVEFSLHPIVSQHAVSFDPLKLPITSAKIKKLLPLMKEMQCKNNSLLTTDAVKRNACVLADDDRRIIVAHLDAINVDRASVSVLELLAAPFAIFECKRVGIEEGMTKGPQTIEKAKQGAYVARAVSALQKIRLQDGRFQGAIERSNGTFDIGPYTTLLRDIIDSPNAPELAGFVLTVGVASNHGNWFTSQNPNKELRVLAQSYDWLLFLTDIGLSQFVEKLLLNPTKELLPAKTAFLASYRGQSGKNQFTKVRIGVQADYALREYFAEHEHEIESWFNVISPKQGQLVHLRADLKKLAAKNWDEVQRK